MKLLVEEEIMVSWWGDIHSPQVSVLCTTYNQEDYIEQAIRSFLMQRTSFPFEIIIHDDASTDKTKEIIEKYCKLYPQIIRPIYQSENQYSQGRLPMVVAAESALGQYLALCEGDDYWIDEKKLENQYNLIKTDANISMIVSPGRLLCEGKLLKSLHGYHGGDIKVVTAQDVLDVTGQFSPTASYFLKKNCLIEARTLFVHAPVGDTFIELYCAVNGRLVYSPEIGSVYRLAAKGSWSLAMANGGVDRQVQHVTKMVKSIELSRNVPGFEALDWSKKLASCYYGLAVSSIKNRDMRFFMDSIVKSRSYSDIHLKQKVLFGFRNIIYLFFKTLDLVRKRH